MARLIYTAITSLDGYVADENGDFDWSAPDEEVHRAVNRLERPIGTYLLGRRMYDVMRYWESPDASAGQPAYVQEYAQIWRAADKVVYSTTLDAPSSARTTLKRTFDADAVRLLKETSTKDVSVAGPGLAGQAIAAGLVDEFRVFISPMVVGGGTPFLPRHVHVDLELLEERRFGNGVVLVRYRSSAR